MNRSTINRLIDRAIPFLAQKGFHLPPFAYWELDEWQRKQSKAGAIFEAQLGWDVTDLGEGDFDRLGLVLFTLRNTTSDPDGKILRTYAEKFIVIRKGQSIPLHFHRVKVEDIINRAGGSLKIELHHSSQDGQLAEGLQTLLMDGVWMEIPSGGIVTLAPGESITIPRRCYHRFWADEEDVLIGEVSTANDDYADNFFLKEYARFPAIVEDEAPRYLLVSDYPAFVEGVAPFDGK
jgi:D-lyxose ketol-isomerase